MHMVGWVIFVQAFGARLIVGAPRTVTRVYMWVGAYGCILGVKATDMHPKNGHPTTHQSLPFEPDVIRKCQEGQTRTTGSSGCLRGRTGAKTAHILCLLRQVGVESAGGG